MVRRIEIYDQKKYGGEAYLGYSPKGDYRYIAFEEGKGVIAHACSWASLARQLGLAPARYPKQLKRSGWVTITIDAE